jgi:hypothetical protein
MVSGILSDFMTKIIRFVERQDLKQKKEDEDYIKIYKDRINKHLNAAEGKSKTRLKLQVFELDNKEVKLCNSRIYVIILYYVILRLIFLNDNLVQIFKDCLARPNCFGVPVSVHRISTLSPLATVSCSVNWRPRKVSTTTDANFFTPSGPCVSSEGSTGLYKTKSGVRISSAKDNFPF